jgi:hypothetical protein
MREPPAGEPISSDTVLPDNVRDPRRIVEVEREKGAVSDPNGGRSWEDKVSIKISAKCQERGWLGLAGVPSK